MMDKSSLKTCIRAQAGIEKQAGPGGFRSLKTAHCAIVLSFSQTGLAVPLRRARP